MMTLCPDSSAPNQDLRRWPGLHGVRPGSSDLPDSPPGWLGLVSVARTPEESSVIGPWTGVGIGPYRAWSVAGPLDPGLVGILAGLLEPLRRAGIPVLAVATHDTDWLLVEVGRAMHAERVWLEAGFRIVEGAVGS